MISPELQWMTVCFQYGNVNTFALQNVLKYLNYSLGLKDIVYSIKNISFTAKIYIFTDQKHV